LQSLPKRKCVCALFSYQHSKGYNGDKGKAESDVETVFKSFSASADAHLFGYPKLTEIMPKVVVDTVLSLLGIDRPETDHTLNDAGNGRRLVEKHRNMIRFCVDDGEW
jgi:hypothetical protein